MGLMQTLGGMIRNGEVEQMRLLDDFREASAGDFAILDDFSRRLERQFGGRNIAVDGVDMPRILQSEKSIATWNGEMIQAVFFNMGNRGNLHALQNGYGLSFDQLRRLAMLATAEEWRAVERIGKRIGELYPRLNAVHFEQTRRALKKVEPSALTLETADGRTITLDGWYYPNVYDGKLSQPDVLMNADAGPDADYRASMEAINPPAREAAGFTHERLADRYGNPVVERPQLLKMSVLMKHMANSTRWVTHAQQLYEFRRLLMDPDVKAKTIEKLGEEKYSYLRQWTNRQARPGKGATAGLNSVIGLARNGHTIAKMGLNLKTALKQTQYIGHLADVLT
ncbi:MAG: hypothetical protein LBJ46_09670, partial [Planctomycetota bacterium]|nr:hypothetical protein [Planctomycetota bacterium]